MDLWQMAYEVGVYRLPKRLDEEVARLHLERIGDETVYIKPQTGRLISEFR